MLKLWSDLFRTEASEPNELEISVEQEISQEWICVDDDQNCEVINIEQHEVLDDATKSRRRKWQKRLIKGRSSQYSSLPVKAKIMRRRDRPSSASFKHQHSSHYHHSTSSASNDQHTLLRAKLKIAVTNANTSTTSEDISSDNNSLNSRSVNRGKCTKSKSSRNKNGPAAQARARYIQQPCQRGMN